MRDYFHALGGPSLLDRLEQESSMVSRELTIVSFADNLAVQTKTYTIMSVNAGAAGTAPIA
jgi:hypothetical protein